MKKTGACHKPLALLLALGLLTGSGLSHAASSDTSKLSGKAQECAGNDVCETGMYTVKRGDTFARIASRYLGCAERWREIVAANPGIKPNRLEIGSELRLPVDAKSDSLLMPRKVAKKAEDGDKKTEPEVVENVDLSFLDDAGSHSLFDSILPEAGSGEDKPPLEGDETPEESATSASLYKNSDLKLPEDIKPGQVSQYFANIKGFHGLFNTESAWYPEQRTLNVGMQVRYDSYRKFDFQGFELGGSQWLMPLNVLFMRHKLMAGLTIPVQSWEVKRSDGNGGSVSFNGMHDPALRIGYQIWRDYAGQQAVSVHFEGRFPSGNYHQPLLNMTDKTRTGVQAGPADATRGGWIQIGGAYSRKLADRWNSHLNLTLANDPRDGISRINPRGSLEYSLDPNCVMLAEIDAPSWTMEKGPDGNNVDMLLGLAWFNEDWQFSVGVPFGLQADWGYKRDIGLVIGLNYRQD